MQTDATVCEIDAHFRQNCLNHKTTRREIFSWKIRIDAQKIEDCCSRILTIKNGSNPVFEPNILAGVEGLEPSRTVLETGMLPLHHTPKERHIKFLLCSICNIGTRLWRPLLYQLSYTPKQQILSFIELPYEHRDTALETGMLPLHHTPILSFQFADLKQNCSNSIA